MFEGYRNEDLIGEGGLGRVYRAVRESTGGTVAIKSLRDVEDSSPAWHRANRELEAMLRVKGHPYVVTVEEIFLGPEGPCLVMEFLPGGSIADRLAAGPMTDPEVVIVGQHVTEALIAAHEVGIVHRDIKPANLMVGSFGQVKVGDFGISALARGDDQTKTASLTLAYASPEELDGDQRVGAPADVFSLAATMHHLITGVRPTFGSRVHGWPSLEGHSAALGPAIAAIEGGLSDDPAARPTMQEFSAAFDQSAALLGDQALKRIGASSATVVRREPTVTSAEESAPSRLALILAGAVAVLALAIGAVVVLGGGDDEPEQPGIADPGTVESEPAEAETTQPAGSQPADSQPDGSAPVVAQPDQGLGRVDGDGVLQIAGLFPSTGPMAEVAAAPEAGARLAVQEINAAGGVLGQPIEFVIADTASTGDGSVAAFAGLATVPDVVIGPTTNDVAEQLVEATREAGVLAISPAATDDALVGDLFVRLVASNSTQGRGIAELIADSGAERVAVVVNDSPGPRSIADAAADADVDVVFERTFESADAAQLAQDLLDEAPDAVLISAFEEETAALVDAIASGAGGSVPFALYGTDANTGDGLADLVSDAAILDGMVGTFVASPVNEESLPELAALQDPSYAAEAYDAVVLAALATVAGGDDAPDALETEIVTVAGGGTSCTSFAECATLLGEGLDIAYTGRSGSLELTEDLERVTAAMLTFRYDALGVFEFEAALRLG